MTEYETNLSNFIDLILSEKYDDVKITKDTYYNKDYYVVSVDTDKKRVDKTFGLNFDMGSISIDMIFRFHKNEISLDRDDFIDQDKNEIIIESELLSKRYEPIITQMFCDKKNNELSSFIKEGVIDLDLESEWRNTKIESVI